MIKKNVLILFLLVTMLCIIGCGEKKKSSPILIVASWGGGYQESQQKAIFEPFQKKMQIPLVDTKTEYGKIREMVRRKNVTVDVADVESFFVFQAGKAGLLEPINYNIIDKTILIPNAVNKYGVGAVVWSTVIVFNKELVNQTPNSWADLWDIEKFPGKRTLRDHPISTIEIALLADGVSPDSLYPLDLKRAFRKLDEIKDIVIWWSDGDRPRQLLSSKEVSLGSSWNGRVYAAIKDGQPLGICWNQGILDMDWWVIPKGSRNLEEANKFLKFAISSDPQANQTNFISYGPVNKNSIGKINKEIIPFIPSSPENLSKQFFINSKWWAENVDQIKEKWDEWKLK